MEAQRSARAVVVLLPAESKRLVAKAVVALPEVRRALEQGRLIIGNGTTNAYVAEELLGRPVPKVNYAAGVIWNGELGTTQGREHLRPFVFVKGQLSEAPFTEAIKEFSAGDVFIKGANAVDPQGHAGVLLASAVGGTMGAILGIVASRGIHLIVPVGLEKLVPSVIEASRHLGQGTARHVMGHQVGLIPLVNAKVVTEVQALETLANVSAVHVSSGGICGSEGSVVIALEGEEAVVDQAYELVLSVKGEPPITE